MHRFYTNIDLSPNSQVLLPEDVAHHVFVLRISPGNTVILFDGHGNSYLATIIHIISRRQIEAHITEQITTNKTTNETLQITLLMCIISNDKMDMVIQKAVELGVTTIAPVISQYSQSLHTSKIESRLAHWKKIIINSCEQCGNNILPTLLAPTKFQDICSSNHPSAITAHNGLRIMLTPRIPQHTPQPVSGGALSHTNNTPNHVQLLVGPEGGFSNTEEEYAYSQGFTPLQLSNSKMTQQPLVLRSETAVISGITYLHIKFGGWQ